MSETEPAYKITMGFSPRCLCRLFDVEAYREGASVRDGSIAAVSHPYG